MSGIYYALSIVAVFVIVHWFITNDKIPPNQPTKGLLAMKDKAKDASDADAPPHRQGRFR